MKNGFTAWSPCEVAAGCDVVEFGRKYPDLVMAGGIDKRILAQGKDAIRRELDRIIPVMKEWGDIYPPVTIVSLMMSPWRIICFTENI